MPARKSSKSSHGNGNKKKVGRKKLIGAGGKVVRQDIPIIVGGGGSTWIWLPEGTPKINPPYTPNYLPRPIDDYDCYEVSWNVKNLYAKDGKGGSKTTTPKDEKNHNTLFSKY